MTGLRKLSFVLALAVLFVAAVPAVHAAGAEEKVFSPFEQVTGSWQGTTAIGSTFLISLEPAKTYTIIFSLPGVGSGHGHGAWERTGLDTFALTDVSLILNPEDGSVALVQKTQVNVKVDGNNADFELLVSLSLPDGTPVDTITTVATAKRIVVEPIP